MCCFRQGCIHRLACGWAGIPDGFGFREEGEKRTVGAGVDKTLMRHCGLFCLLLRIFVYSCAKRHSRTYIMVTFILLHYFGCLSAVPLWCFSCYLFFFYAMRQTFTFVTFLLCSGDRG